MKSVYLIKEKAAIEFDMQITTRQKSHMTNHYN